jgi:D-alanine-D-alanine ligase-like ATP-grasp enzyme
MSTRAAEQIGRRLAAIAVIAAAAALLAWAGPTAAQARTSAGTAATARAVAGGSWGKAREVPGTAALDTGADAYTQQMSCPSAGNCSAAGYYSDSTGATQVFVATQTNGRWGKAIEIPGTATLNAGGNAFTNSVSCASAGNCSAAGDYWDSTHTTHAFVVNEVNGTWDTAEEIPGTTPPRPFTAALPQSVSCASAGNCSAGGAYTKCGSGTPPCSYQAFVVSEVDGIWGTAKEVPGTDAPNTGRNAQVDSVSCTSAGNCSAGGYYTESTGQQAFVATQTNGIWGKAKEVPGTATLNAGGTAQVDSVSCTAAGDCTAGGNYTDSSGLSQAFVATQANGTWGTAQEAPGTAALNTGGTAAVGSVSCTSAGNCAAAGNYTDSSGHGQVFVASQVHGTWGTAQEIPGTAALNTGGAGGIGSVSCASAGHCDVDGNYADSSGHGQVFVASQVHGTWGTAQEIPGTATLNAGGFAEIGQVSCAPAGTCSAGGFYDPGGSPALQAFVVSKS